jgi:TetR/AcrR family transcriptional regulator
MSAAIAKASRPSLQPSGAGPASPVTRDRILDEAATLFSTHGFAATSIRDIASAADLTPAALYNHFPGKEALYQAVLARGVQPLLEMMQGLAARAPTPDTTESVIAEVMAYLAQHPHLPRLIQHEVVSGSEHLRALARDWVAPLLDSAAVQVGRDPRSPWEPHEQPLAIAAWMQLVLGHFSLAPLLRGALPEDPLSPAGIARQTRFLQKLSRLLLRADAPPTE